MKPQAALVTFALMLTAPVALCANAPTAAASEVTEIMAAAPEAAPVPIAPEQAGA